MDDQGELVHTDDPTDREALERLVAFVDRRRSVDRPWLVRFDACTFVLNQARAVIRRDER